MLTDCEEGAKAAYSYYYDQAYGPLTRNIKAEDAIKLFLPPVNEMMVQYVAPLPKDRKEWLEGFKEAQIKIKLELNL